MDHPHPLVKPHPLALPLRPGRVAKPPSATRATSRATAAPKPASAPHLLEKKPASAEPVTVARHHKPPQSFLRRHRWSAAAVATMVIVAGAAMASLLVRQDIATTPSAIAPVVKFQTGTDYAAINAAGFATLTIGSSGASATLSLNGVAGAALTSLTSLAKIQNTDSQAYTVTFARSAAPNAAITDFTITVKNGGSTILSWNAVSAATSGSFSLPAGTTYDINIQLSIADGTSVGSLGAFTMQTSIT